MKRYLIHLVIVAFGSVFFPIAATHANQLNPQTSTVSTAHVVLAAQIKPSTAVSTAQVATTASTTPAPASTASTAAKPAFDPNNPATWPTCPSGEIVWAQDGQCHASATPVATSTPTPTASYASGCSSYTSIFEQYSWSVSTAMAICMAESGGNPYAVSPTDDYGLMQIHQGLELYGTQIYNPSFNISIAYKKYLSQGWEAWSTYNSGAYESYL